MKILIVDQDVIARRAIAKVLQKQTGHQAVVNGDVSTVIETTTNEKPDLLLLGLRHDKVEELALLSSTIRQFPDLPIIMISERSEPGAALALAALRLGAIDFITKPDDGNTILFAERHFSKRVAPIVESALKHKPTNASRSRQSFISSKLDSLKSVWPLNLVVIGGCTGGPAALFPLLKSLPYNLSVPVVVAQHMPKYYSRVLARQLDEVSKFSVQEAESGAELQPGTVWIAPGGYHTEVYRDSNRTVLKVHRGPRENGVRPSIDLLFRSAARLYGPGVLGIILSGIGRDGFAGTAAVKREKGNIIAQDFRTALVPELPLSVVAEGYHDIISPVEYIPDLLMLRDRGGIPSLGIKDLPHESGPKKKLPARSTRNSRVDKLLFNSIT